MANHISAKKRIRRNARRAAINGARMSRIRTFVKKVELAIAAGDADGPPRACQPVDGASASFAPLVWPQSPRIGDAVGHVDATRSNSQF